MPYKSPNDRTLLEYNQEIAYPTILNKLVTQISAHVLQAFLNEGRYVIIDVRSQPDYANGHIPGAINLPFSKATHSFVHPNAASYFSPSKLNIFYCYDQTCDLGEWAALKASCIGREKNGISTYPVANLIGNWNGWIEDSGRPVAR
jgi:rhodanese-related sulfurtransferase